MKELVEFFTIKSVHDGELQGRVSGDLAWRLLRGETKPQQDEYKVSKISVERLFANRDCIVECSLTVSGCFIDLMTLGEVLTGAI